MIKKYNVCKVVLLNPPMRAQQVYGNLVRWGSVSPPLGLCYIASLLQKNCYDVHLLDAEALHLSLSETVEQVRRLNPDIVGVACKTLWVNSAHRVAERLKEIIPNTLIIAGGNHVSAMPQRSLQDFAAFDILVIGEGELTFLELLDSFRNGTSLADVSGIAFRNNGESVVTSPRARIKNLDTLPPPAFELLPKLATHYSPSLNCIQFQPAFSLVTSRGCSGKCTFCDRKVFGNQVTFHSPEYTMNLIRNIYFNHGIRFLLFDDDNLLLNKKYCSSLLKMMKEAEFHMPFTCQSRVDTIDEENLLLLKSAGCFKIMYGIESGSPKILNRMRKRIGLDQVRKAISLTKKAGILPSGFFIIGYPGETIETLEETVKLIRECDFFDIVVLLFAPLPGSEIYEDIHRWGTYDENWEKTNSIDQSTFLPAGLSTDILMKYMSRCYTACLLKPRQLFSMHKRFSSRAHLKALMSSLHVVLLPPK